MAALTGLSLGGKLGLALGILVFTAVLGGFYYLSKRVSKGAFFSGRRVKVLDRMMVSRDVTILILQIGTRLLAVGVGKSGATLLCELSPSDFPELLKKTEEPEGKTGFLNRFARNMKAGFTGSEPVQPDNDASFAEILQKIAESRPDPVPGAVNAGDAGYPHLWEEEPRYSVPSAPQRPKRPNYQASIENMTRLSEPDALDSKVRYSGAPPVRTEQRVASAPVSYTPPPTYVPPPAYTPPPLAKQDVPPVPVAEPTTEEERTGRIDDLLDLIAQRQSRMDNRNNTGDKG